MPVLQNLHSSREADNKQEYIIIVYKIIVYNMYKKCNSII